MKRNVLFTTLLIALVALGSIGIASAYRYQTNLGSYQNTPMYGGSYNNLARTQYAQSNRYSQHTNTYAGNRRYIGSYSNGGGGYGIAPSTIGYSRQNYVPNHYFRGHFNGFTGQYRDAVLGTPVPQGFRGLSNGIPSRAFYNPNYPSTWSY